MECRNLKVWRGAQKALRSLKTQECFDILAAMNKITLAGNILVDNVKTISAWPEKGMLVPITSLARAVGGSVCNSGIDLKTLDPSIEVRALGKVGRLFAALHADVDCLSKMDFTLGLFRACARKRYLLYYLHFLMG